MRPAGSDVRPYPGRARRRRCVVPCRVAVGRGRPGRELGRRWRSRSRSPLPQLRRFSPRRCGHGGLHTEWAHARRGRRRSRGKEPPAVAGRSRPRRRPRSWRGGRGGSWAGHRASPWARVPLVLRGGSCWSRSMADCSPGYGQGEAALSLSVLSLRRRSRKCPSQK